MSIFLLPEFTYDRAPLLQYALNQTNWDSNPIMPGVFSPQWGETTENIDPIFDEIRQKFKDQSIVIGACFMRIKPNWTMPMHIDPNRLIGVNLPLTQSLSNGGVDIYNKGGVVSKFYTDCTYIIDTSSPHGAHNITDEENIFLSLSFKKDIGFTEIVEWQINGELLQ